MESPCSEFLRVNHSDLANVLAVEQDRLEKSLSDSDTLDEKSRIGKFLNGEFPLLIVMGKNKGTPVSGRRLKSLPRKRETPAKIEFYDENPYSVPRGDNDSRSPAYTESGSTAIGGNGGNMNNLIDGPM
jgi:hypothetical protein